MRMPCPVEPGDVFQPDRVNYERVPIPLADRLAHVGGIRVVGKFSPVRPDVAYRVVFFEEDKQTVTDLKDFKRKNFGHESGHSSWKTTRHCRVQVNSSIGDAGLAWVIVLVC